MWERRVVLQELLHAKSVACRAPSPSCQEHFCGHPSIMPVSPLVGVIYMGVSWIPCKPET